MTVVQTSRASSRRHRACPLHSPVQPLLLAAALHAQEARVVATTEIYPAGPRQLIGDERWLTARIVDGLTQAPLPGAELLLVAESNHPIRGEFWWSMRAVADADGFVRLRIDEQAPGYQSWSWVVARAPGYGAWAEHRSWDNVIALAPAETLPVQVRDWQDRPVAGALVGFCGGCGHTPDLSHARTEANGLALLGGVDPRLHIHDLYVEHPLLHLGYEEFTWFPGMPPVVFRVDPGTASVGVVVDPKGQPVAGAFVGYPEVHRGPWTRTAADGSFRLYGVEGPTELHVHHGVQHVVFAREGVEPFRLQLPAPDGEQTQTVGLPLPPASPGDLLVRIQIVDENGEPLAASYRCTGPLPAFGGQTGVQDGSRVDLALHPGRYELAAWSDVHEEARQTVEVTAGGERAFRLQPKPLPAAVVQVAGPPEYCRVELRTATENRDITSAVEEGRAVGLPAEPFCFVLHGGRHQRRVFAFDRARALATQPLRLPWFLPTRVVGRAVDARGAPLAVTVRIAPILGGLHSLSSDDDDEAVVATGDFALASEHDGLAFLVVRAAGDVPPRIVPLILPPRGDDVRIDAGTIVVGGPPALVLRRANGAALAGDAGFLRRGWVDFSSNLDRFALDAEGRWWGPDPRAGDVIVVPEERAEAPATDPGIRAVIDVAVRFPLAGDGPWTLQLPAGELLLDVRAPIAEARPHATFCGEHVSCGGRTLLRRLRPGPLRLWVAAEGCRAAIVDVAVPATGRAVATVALEPR